MDDEVALVRLTQHVLTKLGYAVETATNPLTAIELVRADPSRFALVMTDLTMPEMTGLDLAARLLRIRANLPIILLTGNTDAVTATEAETQGLQGLLFKPASIHDLGTAVHATLARQSVAGVHRSRAAVGAERLPR